MKTRGILGVTWASLWVSMKTCDVFGPLYENLVHYLGRHFGVFVRLYENLGCLCASLWKLGASLRHPWGVFVHFYGNLRRLCASLWKYGVSYGASLGISKKKTWDVFGRLGALLWWLRASLWKLRASFGHLCGSFLSRRLLTNPWMLNNSLTQKF